MGVRADGTKELIAMADGYRESAESWADLLRDCRAARACALRSWRSATARWASGRRWREVFPQTRHQRCWVHKTANVSNALPKSAQPGGEEGSAGDLQRRGPRARREGGRRVRARRTGRSTPRPSRRSPTTVDELLAFYDFPAEHWIHLRTTNPIESTFATVRLRTKVTRGAGSPAAALAMVFKLVESAQARWRAVNAPHLVALVRAGARFENGLLVERPGGDAALAGSADRRGRSRRCPPPSGRRGTGKRPGRR